MIPSGYGSGFQNQLLQAIYDTAGPGGMGRGGWQNLDTGYNNVPQGQLNQMMNMPMAKGGPMPSQLDDIQKEQTRRASNLLQDKFSYGMGDGFGNQRLARAVRIFGRPQSQLLSALDSEGIQPW